MKVIIHNDIEALERIIPTWERLIEGFRDITVFQDSSWLANWWRFKSLNNSWTPYILEIIDHDQTVAVLPLYISKERFARLTFNVLKPIGAKDSDYLIPILSKDYPSETLLNLAFKKLNDDKSKWDYLEWKEIPEGTPFAHFLDLYQQTHREYLEKKAVNECPFVEIDGDFEKVKTKIDEATIGQALKKEKKLKNKGDLDYRKVEMEQDFERVMDKFFELSCQRWKNTGTPSKFEQKEERDYLMVAAEQFLKKGLLHLTYISFNNEIIAINFGMLDEARIYFYLQAIDLEFSKYSPGSILVYYLIRGACQEGYKVFDFLRGAENYKKRWGTIDRVNFQYNLFNRSIKSKMYKKLVFSDKFDQLIVTLDKLKKA